MSINSLYIGIRAAGMISRGLAGALRAGGDPIVPSGGLLVPSQLEALDVTAPSGSQTLFSLAQAPADGSYRTLIVNHYTYFETDDFSLDALNRVVWGHPLTIPINEGVADPIYFEAMGDEETQQFLVLEKLTIVYDGQVMIPLANTPADVTRFSLFVDGIHYRSEVAQIVGNRLIWQHPSLVLTTASNAHILYALSTGAAELFTYTRWTVESIDQSVFTLASGTVITRPDKSRLYLRGLRYAYGAEADYTLSTSNPPVLTWLNTGVDLNLGDTFDLLTWNDDTIDEDVDGGGGSGGSDEYLIVINATATDDDQTVFIVTDLPELTTKSLLAINGLFIPQLSSTYSLTAVDQKKIVLADPPPVAVKADDVVTLWGFDNTVFGNATVFETITITTEEECSQFLLPSGLNPEGGKIAFIVSDGTYGGMLVTKGPNDESPVNFTLASGGIVNWDPDGDWPLAIGDKLVGIHWSNSSVAAHVAVWTHRVTAGEALSGVITTEALSPTPAYRGDVILSLNGLPLRYSTDYTISSVDQLISWTSVMALAEGDILAAIFQV